MSRSFSMRGLPLYILLHHSIQPDPPENAGSGWEEHREELIREGLVDYDPERPALADDHCVLTERGRAYLRMLLATPLPVQQWVDPREAA